MQSELDAMRRELADTRKRLDKAEASIERMLAQMPRRSTPSELVNQTYSRERILQGLGVNINYATPDPLGR